MIFVYITCSSAGEARKISMHLLKNKLVACTNVLPVDSSYWWKGKIESRKEWMIVAKSVKNNFGKIKIEVKKIHSYDVPEIVAVDAEANEEYSHWVMSTLL